MKRGWRRRKRVEKKRGKQAKIGRMTKGKRKKKIGDRGGETNETTKWRERGRRVDEGGV